MKQKSTSTRIIHITVALLPSIIWMGVIFYLSSIPSLASGLPSIFDLILRKIAHVTEYAILTVLLYSGIRKLGVAKFVALLCAAMFALIYAITDEYHQQFVPGRHGAARDVFIDSMGITMTWLFLAVYKKS